MKTYKLKKDLPTFKVGSLFKLGEDGCLWLDGPSGVQGHWKPQVMAYHCKTLARFPNILKDWFEEIKEGSWEPEEHDSYYYLYCDGDVERDIWEGTNMDKEHYAIGNVFRSREEAEKAVEWLKARKVLMGDTKGFEPDWVDETQTKWYVYWDHEEGYLDVRCTHNMQTHQLYFATKKDAHSSIYEHGEEWKIYLGVEE